MFDSGLIGEGALHALAAARQKLVAPDAVLVPAAATVSIKLLTLHGSDACCYGPVQPILVSDFRCICTQVFAQPLELRRHGSMRGFDVSAANQWHWRPDYEGVELALCR